MLAILFKLLFFILIKVTSPSLDIFIKKYSIKKSKVYSEDLISILGTINGLQQVDIVGEKGDYYKIKWKKSTGYILKKYLVDKINAKIIGEIILSVNKEVYADIDLKCYLGNVNKGDKFTILEIIDMKNYKIFKTINFYIKIKRDEYIFREIK